MLIFLFDFSFSFQVDIPKKFPLGPVLLEIFMVELERNLLPMLSFYMTSSKSYVGDIIVYGKPSAPQKNC